MVPAERGPKVLKLKSSWHRSRNLAVSLKHCKLRRGGGGSRGGGDPLRLRCAAVRIHAYTYARVLRRKQPRGTGALVRRQLKSGGNRQGTRNPIPMEKQYSTQR